MEGAYFVYLEYSAIDNSNVWWAVIKSKLTNNFINSLARYGVPSLVWLQHDDGGEFVHKHAMLFT